MYPPWLAVVWIVLFSISLDATKMNKICFSWYYKRQKHSMFLISSACRTEGEYTNWYWQTPESYQPQTSRPCDQEPKASLKGVWISDLSTNPKCFIPNSQASHSREPQRICSPVTKNNANWRCVQLGQTILTIQTMDICWKSLVNTSKTKTNSKLHNHTEEM